MAGNGHSHPVIDFKTGTFVEFLLRDKELNQILQSGFVAVGEPIIERHIFLKVVPPECRERLLQFAPASPVAVEEQIKQ